MDPQLILGGKNSNFASTRAMVVCFDDRFPLRMSSGGENGTIYYMYAQFSIEPNPTHGFSFDQITSRLKPFVGHTFVPEDTYPKSVFTI